MVSKKCVLRESRISFSLPTWPQKNSNKIIGTMWTIYLCDFRCTYLKWLKVTQIFKHAGNGQELNLSVSIRRYWHLFYLVRSWIWVYLLGGTDTFFIQHVENGEWEVERVWMSQWKAMVLCRMKFKKNPFTLPLRANAVVQK